MEWIWLKKKTSGQKVELRRGLILKYPLGGCSGYGPILVLGTHVDRFIVSVLSGSQIIPSHSAIVGW